MQLTDINIFLSHRTKYLDILENVSPPCTFCGRNCHYRIRPVRTTIDSQDRPLGFHAIVFLLNFQVGYVKPGKVGRKNAARKVRQPCLADLAERPCAPP